MQTTRMWATALAIALLGLAVAVPAATADVEPNDGITQVEGPLGGGVTYNGTTGTTNDVDWYVVYVNPQTQLDIALTTPGDTPCGTYDDSYLTLRTSDGSYVTDIAAAKNQTAHIRYTTPSAVTRFLIVARSACVGGRYQFRLDPGTAVVSGPGLVTPLGTPEPNESASQAFGPLSGGTPYSGAIETENDVDWFWFYTAGPFAVDVSLTSVASCSSYSSTYATIYPDGDDDSIGSVSAELNTVGHRVFTAPGAARYLVKVDGCQGASYRLQLDPGTAISLTPPPPPPPPPVLPPPAAPVARPRPSPRAVTRRCRTARAGLTRWTRALAKTRRQLSSVRTRAAKKQLKRKRAAQTRTLRRAKDRVTIYCK